MRELFNINVTDEDLMKLARNLGCDVPFFIKGGAAIARGIGDELKFFKLPKMNLVIYYPGYPISTKWAYEEYDKSNLTTGIETDNILMGKKKKERTGFNINNDFEKVVFKFHPDLLDIKTNLLANGAYMVSLSGSGSCLYAVVDENVKKKVIKYLSGIGAMYFEAETV
jgi:4-diphosphocytidyl-2-C-methyl-D-erythritol kinase